MYTSKAHWDRVKLSCLAFLQRRAFQAVNLIDAAGGLKAEHAVERRLVSSAVALLKRGSLENGVAAVLLGKGGAAVWQSLMTATQM